MYSKCSPRKILVASDREKMYIKIIGFNYRRKKRWKHLEVRERKKNERHRFIHFYFYLHITSAATSTISFLDYISGFLTGLPASPLRSCFRSFSNTFFFYLQNNQNNVFKNKNVNHLMLLPHSNIFSGFHWFT